MPLMSNRPERKRKRENAADAFLLFFIQKRRFEIWYAYLVTVCFNPTQTHHQPDRDELASSGERIRIFHGKRLVLLLSRRRKSIRLAPLVQHTRSTPASETHHGEAPEDREDPRPIRCGRHAHHSPQGASRTPRGRFLARPRDDTRHDVAHLPRSPSAARARRRP